MLGLIAAVLGLAKPAAAESLMFHAGSFDAFRGTESSLIGLEWDSKGPFAKLNGRKFGKASFIAGGTLTGRVGGYVYAGGRFEFPVGKPLGIGASFAPGIFFAGHGKDLGGAIEFRSGIDLAYRLGDGGSVGMGLFHYSNGKIYGENPGSEAVVVTYRFPVFRAL